MPDDHPSGDLVRGIGDELAVGGHHLGRIVERTDKQAREHLGTDLVEVELEGRDDTEVAAAPEPPEEVGVLVLAGVDETTVGRDHVRPAEIVGGQTVSTGEPAETPAERQAGDSRRRIVSDGRGEAERLCLVVELCEYLDFLR
nr:hypothetical protein [Halogeometricum pallidum]